MCPGQKENKSVRVDGHKVQMQKRLLLLNLRELHQEYDKIYPKEISFSKFCELRPKWCMNVNSKGMPSICLCEHHQNAKLLASVTSGINDYKELLTKMVCDFNQCNCMMHSCDARPGKTGLNKYHSEMFTENDTDTKDSIHYKQRTSFTTNSSLILIEQHLLTCTLH